MDAKNFLLSAKLYFDNDFIPMNKTFILLAKIYNSKNKLGSNFNNLINLAKKIIEVKDNKLDNYDLEIYTNFRNLFH